MSGGWNETMRAVIAGLGAWIPPTVLTNAELCATLDTTSEWIETRTGILERRVVSDGVSTRELALEAGARALASARLSTVDAVVVATTSPERICPAVAPEVAFRLGLGTVPAFDVASACSGFLYGLATCAGLIAGRLATRVLLIGAEAFTAFINPKDRVTRPIFGDGAAAMVLRAGLDTELGAVGPIDLGSDGRLADALAIPEGGARGRVRGGPVAGPLGEDCYLRMDGRRVFIEAVKRMTQSSRTALKQAGWTHDEVDWFVGHQANLRILRAVAEELALPEQKLATNIDRVGNTLTASVGLLLCDYASRGELVPGQRVLMSAFGAGLSWGSTTFSWPAIAVAKLD